MAGFRYAAAIADDADAGLWVWKSISMLRCERYIYGFLKPAFTGHFLPRLSMGCFWWCSGCWKDHFIDPEPTLASARQSSLPANILSVFFSSPYHRTHGMVPGVGFIRPPFIHWLNPLDAIDSPPPCCDLVWSVVDRHRMPLVLVQSQQLSQVMWYHQSYHSLWGGGCL